MIDKRIINDLRKKVTFTAIVSKIEYKHKTPTKILLRKIRKDDIIVVPYLDIKFPKKFDGTIRKNQKIQFNGYLMPAIMKNSNREEYVGVKVKNISGVKSFCVLN